MRAVFTLATLFASLSVVLSGPLTAQDEGTKSPGERAKELVVAIEDEEIAARRKAVESLPGLGPEGVAAFVSALSEAFPEAAAVGIDVLLEILARDPVPIDPSAVDVPVVKKWVEGAHEAPKTRALRLLALLGTEPAIAALVERFPEAAEADRNAIGEELKKKRPKAAVEPFLGLAADREKKTEVRVAALGILGGLRRVSAAERLTGLLSDPSSEIRSEAFEALKAASGRSDLAFDPNASTGDREKALEKLADWLALRQVTIGLDSDDEAKIERATARLARPEDTCVKELAWATKELEEPRGRARSAALLAEHVRERSSQAKPALVAALQDRDPAVQAAAARALGRDPFSTDASVQAALRTLFRNSGAPAVREAAAGALYRLGDDTAYEFARRMLFHGETSRRKAALEILGGGGKKEVEILLAFVDGKIQFPGTVPGIVLSGPDAPADLAEAARDLADFARRASGLRAPFPPEERRNALEAIGRVGGSFAIRALRERTLSEDPAVREGAVAGLARLAERGRADLLVEFKEPFVRLLAEDPAPGVRVEAARLLGALRILSAAAALAEAAGAKEPELRAAALAALAALDDPTLIPAVEKGLEDPDRAVRIAAARALAGAPHDVDLAGVLAAAKAEKDAEVRRALAELVSLVPHPDSADWLAGLLDDEDAALRRAAADGIEDWLGHDLEYDPDAAAEARRQEAGELAAELREARIAAWLDRLTVPAADPGTGDLETRIENLRRALASDESMKALVALGREAAIPIARRLGAAREAELRFQLVALERIAGEHGLAEDARAETAAALGSSRDLERSRDPLLAALAAEVVLAEKETGAPGRRLLSRVLARLSGERLARAALRLAQGGERLDEAARERLLDLAGGRAALLAIEAFQALGPGDGLSGVLRWVDAGDEEVAAKAISVLEGWKWPGTVVAVRDRLAARREIDPALRLARVAWALSLAPRVSSPGSAAGALDLSSARRDQAVWAAGWVERSAAALAANDRKLLEIACASAPLPEGTLPLPAGEADPLAHLDGWLGPRRDLVLALSGLASQEERRCYEGRGEAHRVLAGASPEAMALAMAEIRTRRPDIPATYRAELVAILAANARANDWDAFLAIARSDEPSPLAAAAARYLRNVVGRQGWNGIAPVIGAGAAADRLAPRSPGPDWSALARSFSRRRTKILEDLTAVARSQDAGVRFYATQAIVWLEIPEDMERDTLLAILPGSRSDATREILVQVSNPLRHRLGDWFESRRPEKRWQPRAVLAPPIAIGAGATAAAGDLVATARALAQIEAVRERESEENELAMIEPLLSGALPFRSGEHPVHVRIAVYRILKDLALGLGSEDLFLQVVPRAISPGIGGASAEEGPETFVLDAAVADLSAAEKDVRSAAHQFLRFAADQHRLPEKANQYQASGAAGARAEPESAWRDWLSDARVRAAVLEETRRFEAIALEVGAENLAPARVEEFAAELGRIVGTREEAGRQILAGLIPTAIPSLRAVLLSVHARAGAKGEVDLALAELDHGFPAVRKAAYEALAALSKTKEHDRWISTESGEPPAFDAGPGSPLEIHARAEDLEKAWKAETEARAKKAFLSELEDTRRPGALDAYHRLDQAGRLAIDWLSGLAKAADPGVRELVATGLGRLERSPEAARALVGALEDEAPAVRKAAIEGLERLAGTRLDYDPEAADRTAAVKAWQERAKLLDQPATRETFFAPVLTPIRGAEARQFLERLAVQLAPHRAGLVELYQNPDPAVPAEVQGIERETRTSNVRRLAARLLAETLWLPGARTLLERLRTGPEEDQRIAWEALQRMTGESFSLDKPADWQGWLDMHEPYLEKP